MVDAITCRRSVVSRILRYVASGEEMLALRLFASMQAEGVPPDSRAFVAALRACTGLATSHGGKTQHDALEAGRKIHHQLVPGAGTSIGTNPFVVSTLIDMYAKCGSLCEARMVFDRSFGHGDNVVAWNAMIFGYVNSQQERKALDLFSDMMRERGREPTSRTFVAALKACSGLAEKEVGRRVYEDGDSRLVKLHALETAMAIHSHAQSAGLDTDIFVANSLVALYAKCGSLVSSSEVFDRMASRDVVSWTSMVLGYADCGREELALEAFARMHLERCKPNPLAFVAAIKACINLAARETWKEIHHGRRYKPVALERGMALHSQALKESCCDQFVLGSLVDLYGRCGSLADAWHVFAQTREHVVPLTSLMLGHVESGEARTALELFQGSPRKAVDAQAFVAASRACRALAEEERSRVLDGKPVKVGALETCMAIHSEAVARCHGAESSAHLTSCLIDLYACCGSLVDAARVFNGRRFQDVFSWTALISGYVGNGQGALALQTFEVMQRSPYSSPHIRCFAAGLAACAATGDSEAARKIRQNIYRHGMEDRKMFEMLFKY